MTSLNYKRVISLTLWGEAKGFRTKEKYSFMNLEGEK